MNFLYQSIRSSYCGVYASANLLNLHGIEVKRSEILKQFGFSKAYQPIVTHKKIKDVLNNYFETNLIWNCYNRFSYNKVVAKLNDLSKQNIPTLITFTAVNSFWKSCGIHCVIFLKADDAGIHILDSLGQRNKKIPNAIISPKRIKNKWKIDGTQISLTNGKFHVLMGLPAMR